MIKNLLTKENILEFFANLMIGCFLPVIFQKYYLGLIVHFGISGYFILKSLKPENIIIRFLKLILSVSVFGLTLERLFILKLSEQSPWQNLTDPYQAPMAYCIFGIILISSLILIYLDFKGYKQAQALKQQNK